MAGKTVMLTGSYATAEAATLAKPKVIAAYPITPQTEIIEYLGKQVDSGRLKSKFMIVESEHSALAACAGAAWTGVRTYTATSAHGLLYMGEWVFWCGYGRLPVIMPVVNRALSPGWTIWVDHQDTMAFRDAGWIQIYTKNNQELFDTTLQAFKLGESKDIALPVMPCLDGFILSHTAAKVELITQEEADDYVGEYSDPVIRVDTEKPWAYGSLVLPDKFNADRKDLMEAMERAKTKIKKINKEFGERFGRTYGNGLVEHYGDEEADLTIVSIGTTGDETEEAIDRLKEEGLSVNALRIRTYRPFPVEDIVEVAKKNHKLLVLDRAVSFGNEGINLIEVESALKRNKVDTPVVGRVMGLGGEDIPFTRIMDEAKKILKGQ